MPGNVILKNISFLLKIGRSESCVMHHIRFFFINVHDFFLGTYDTGTFEILTPGCLFSDAAQPAQFYNVFVRAVNIGANGEILPGPWSQPTKGFCYLTKSK